MTEEQLIQIRDGLIADLNLGLSPLAVKFEPYLRDKMNMGKQEDAATMDAIKAACKAFVMAAHTEAISRLREELANDPTDVGYVGKSPEELQALLTKEVSVYADQDVGLTEAESVATGVALANNLPYKATPAKVQIVVAVRPPRLGTIWAGIPYARNLPSLDNIAEALK